MTLLIGHNELEQLLDWNLLIDQLRRWYRDGAVEAPDRHVLTLRQPDGSEATMLIMPAWVPGQDLGVKVVTFFPQNAASGIPTINAGYLLFDGATGQIQATLDGDVLTARRTAATSALAADYLARADAERLLIVGTGQLALAVAQAHATVRSYQGVKVWGRDNSKASAIATSLREIGLNTEAVDDLRTACQAADVISTVTAASQPIVKGEWLRPGTHLDLIGAFKPDMRESDDQALIQAQVFVDRRESAVLAGDLAQPLQAEVISQSHLLADLADLCQGRHPGRQDAEAFTLFKSAGTALQDLAAATLARDQFMSG